MIDLNNLTIGQKKKIVTKLSPVDIMDLFRDHLDELYSSTFINNIEYEPSTILENLNPRAFKDGLRQFRINGKFIFIDWDYYNYDSVKEC